MSFVHQSWTHNDLQKMLQRVKRYVYDRRKSFMTTTGVVATIYFAGRYVLHRLEEIKESAMQAHAAREK
jgi:peroxin-3